MVQAGDPAPDFRLPADNVSEVSLSGYRGRKVRAKEHAGRVREFLGGDS